MIDTTVRPQDGRPERGSESPDHVPAHGAMGTMLGPVLIEACGGRLSDLHWFRTDWQRGGALTGYARYRDDAGRQHDVVVKLPVPPCERHWLVTLQSAKHVVPRVFAHGETVGGYDLAWVVMERLKHGPLSAAWRGGEFDLLIEAAGRFYAAAHPVPRRGEPMDQDWPGILDMARKAVRNRALPQAQRWSSALKKAQRKLDSWLRVWRQRGAEDWCHGDLHLGNALTRAPAPEGPALLIDFALTRVGHWVEDAVYFEHLFWAQRERLGGRRLCKQIADERKKLGLAVGGDWAQLAQVKRALQAMSTPAQLRHAGDPQHVHAALAVLEQQVG